MTYTQRGDSLWEVSDMYQHYFDVLYDDRTSAQMQGGKTQAHSNTTFATRLLFGHCKITGFIISTSSFSPLGRKFCNICLLLRYTRGHEPLRTFNFNISICLWRFVNKYETLYHGVNYLLVGSKGSKNLKSRGKTHSLRTDKFLSAEFSDSIQQ